MFALTLLAFPRPVALEAQEWVEATRPSIGMAVGTSGLGIEASLRPWDRVGARLALGWFPFEPEVDEDEVTGTISFPSPVTRVTVSFFPRSGGFQLSSGLHRFPGGLSVRAVVRDSVEMNDRDHAPGDLGGADGTGVGTRNRPLPGTPRPTGRLTRPGEHPGGARPAGLAAPPSARP